MLLEARKKYVIDPELLVPGEEFKNYKELCERLNLPPTGGNDKTKLLEELKRYCEYEKADNSHKIKIIEVYDEEIEDDPSFKALIVENLCSLFVEHYKQNGNFIMHKTFRNLITDLYLVNDNYKALSFEPEKLNLLLDLDEHNPISVLFFEFVNERTRYYTNTAIKALENMKLIKMYKVLWVKEGFNWRAATDKEKSITLRNEKLALELVSKKYQEYPIKGLSDIIRFGFSMEYFNAFEEFLKEDDEATFQQTAELYQFVFSDYLEKFYLKNKMPKDKFIDLNKKFIAYIDKYTIKQFEKFCSIKGFAGDMLGKLTEKEQKIYPYKATYKEDREKIKKHVVER